MRDEQTILTAYRKFIDPSNPAAIGPVFGPVPEETICEAENMIGARFPNEYRLFLRHYGAANHGPYHIYGLFQEDDYNFFIDVATETLDFRTVRRNDIANADKTIPIATDGDGVQYFLDISNSDHSIVPVFAISPRYGIKLAASDFVGFVGLLANVHSVSPFQSD